MSNSQKARDLAHAVEAANRQASAFFYPHVQQWLKIQFRLGRLNQKDADREFTFDEITEDTIDFISEDWEETWAFGGREQHFGHAIRIPFAFFDDETPFLKEADDFEYKVEQSKKSSLERSRLATVKRLESELAEARKNAGLDT